MGLVDKIRLASSVAAVEKLLVEGNSYRLASEKTKRRWKYVAVRKLKELQTQVEVQTAEKKKTKSKA